MNAEVKAKLRALNDKRRAAKKLLKDFTPLELAVALDELKACGGSIVDESPLATDQHRVVTYFCYASAEQVAELAKWLPHAVYWDYVQMRRRYVRRILFDAQTLDALIKFIGLTDEPETDRKRGRSAIQKYTGRRRTANCFEIESSVPNMKGWFVK